MVTRDKTRRRAGYVFILIFGLLAAGIVVGGAYYYRNYERNFRVEVERQLSAIAGLKVDELVRYRQERLADAAVFYKNAAFSALVKRHFEHPEDQEAGDQLRTWLGHMQAASQYDRVMLLDTLYSEKMIIPDGPERSTSFVSPSSSEGLRSGKVVFEDFYWNEQNQRIYLEVLVPILDEAHDGRVIGILALRIDPEIYLYPFISRWPTASRTAETLLIRRDGNDALFLNELKFQKETALRLRISLGNKDVPAVNAVLGQEGIVEGMDYRGVAVIAALRPVPDSPWFLVARMDTSEVFGPMRERLREIIIIAALLLLGTGAALGFIWRQQGARFYGDRYKATEALRESEERFRLAINATKEGLWEWDIQTNQEFFSPRWCEIIGYSFDDPELPHTYNSWTSRIHPDDYDRVISALNNHLEKGTKYDVDYRHRHKTGEYRWQNSIGQAVLDESGKPTKMVGCISDITERKREEAALRESEERYRTLIEDVGEGIGFVNPEEQFAFANAAAEDIFGVPPSGLLGRSLREFARPEQFGMIREQTDRRRAGEKSVYEIEISRPNGEKRNLLITAVPQFDSQGQFVGTFGVFRDITERKRAEEAVQASLREKEILLREIHHRVKNNMQVISSLFNLQAGYIKDEEALRILKEGQTRIRSMALVHEKLYQSGDLSKIDLAGYIQSLSAHLFHVYLVDPNQVRLETEFGDVTLDINSAVPCGLILNELISNALKHAFPAGRKGVLMIRLRRGKDRAVELRIADNGVGFPEGLDFQSTESLGLQIVNLLVGQLEGTIKLDRKNGTAFTVAFHEMKQGLRT